MTAESNQGVHPAGGKYKINTHLQLYEYSQFSLRGF